MPMPTPDPADTAGINATMPPCLRRVRAGTVPKPPPPVPFPTDPFSRADAGRCAFDDGTDYRRSNDGESEKAIRHDLAMPRRRPRVGLLGVAVFVIFGIAFAVFVVAPLAVTLLAVGGQP